MNDNTNGGSYYGNNNNYYDMYGNTVNQGNYGAGSRLDNLLGSFSNQRGCLMNLGTSLRSSRRCFADC